MLQVYKASYKQTSHPYIALHFDRKYFWVLFLLVMGSLCSPNNFICCSPAWKIHLTVPSFLWRVWLKRWDPRWTNGNGMVETCHITGKNHALGAARMNCHLRTLSRILLIKQNYIMLIMIIMIIVMISITVSSKNDL